MKYARSPMTAARRKQLEQLVRGFNSPDQPVKFMHGMSVEISLTNMWLHIVVRARGELTPETSYLDPMRVLREQQDDGSWRDRPPNGPASEIARAIHIAVALMTVRIAAKVWRDDEGAWRQFGLRLSQGNLPLPTFRSSGGELAPE